ncbi:hypothetical protein MTO96_031949 [Rhipicephalus appendiculatus]
MLAAAHFDYPGRPSIGDLLKFYEKDQVTYLVKRTYASIVEGQAPKCIHNKVDNVSDKALDIYQGYTYHQGGLRVSIKYAVNIKLSRDKGYDVAPTMTADKSSVPKMKRNYRFHYYDDNAHCAVLTFKDYSGTLRCELHTWKTTATYTRYGNCEAEYMYQCPGHKSHSVDLSHCPEAV